MRKQSEEKLEAEPSNEMVKSIFKQMKKFKKYEDFLVSVGAMKKINSDYSVIKYPKEQLIDYENKLIREHMKTSLNDEYIFSDKSKFTKKSEEGIVYDTGYFIPRFFWDYILNKIKKTN